MGLSHSFCGVGDQFSGYQRIFHSLMSHGNAVAHGDSRKYNRHSARQGHPLLYCLLNFIQIPVSRHNLVF